MTVTAARGIPTTYRQTRFRSRLEARWAAFFDLIGWRWTYEPFDTDGWIPDFLLEGTIPLLVEVGPCSTLDEFKAKAEKPAAWFGHPTLILGISPIVLDDNVPGLMTNSTRLCPQDVPYWMQCDQHLEDPFLTTVRVYTDVIGGVCGHGIGQPVAGHRLFDLWASAGNQVQWKPRRR